MDVRDLEALEGPTITSALKRLEKKGLVVLALRRPKPCRGRYSSCFGYTSPPNDQQQAALIISVVVTTAAIFCMGLRELENRDLQAAEHIIAQTNKHYTVPEIALTPLLIGRVKARFGNKVAALHSGLKQSERLREWQNSCWRSRHCCRSSFSFICTLRPRTHCGRRGTR